MLSKHARTVAMMNRDHSLAYLLRDYFGLRRGTALMPALLERGLGQADLVLALLRLRDAHRGPYGHYIELLVGHPIKVGPSCLQLYNAPPPPPAQAATRDDRRIVHVHPTNPRQPGTGAYAEWSLYRVGRTLGQLYVRGVSRRDVRRVISNQWIRVEAA